MKKGWLAALLLVIATIVFVITTTVVTNSTSDNPSLVVMPENKKLPSFSFEMANNKTFTNENLVDHWTLFFIGYTFCPDVCPTTLADLDRIYPELSKPPFDNIQIVFVSVDPNRDKANNLAEYVNYFNPKFLGTTSTHKQLFPFAQDLGLVYSIVNEGDVGDAYYMVDHSASLVLINTQGLHHATFKPVRDDQGVATVDMDLMTQDIHNLIQQNQ
ncbi:MAG: SCO family protein [Psychromonas sp.]|nr:SCO family protein [Psychromonas sp.]